jgi:hypothetical protein
LFLLFGKICAKFKGFFYKQTYLSKSPSSYPPMGVLSTFFSHVVLPLEVETISKTKLLGQ